MAKFSERNFWKTKRNCRTGVSKIVRCATSDNGVTLVELLAALVISVLLMVVIGQTMTFQAKMWSGISERNILHSYVQLADQRLQQEFQDIVSLNTQSVQTDLSGQTLLSDGGSTGNFEMQIVPTKSVNGTKLYGIQVTDGSKVSTLQWAAIDFSGTTFTFDSTNDTVTVHFVAHYINEFGRAGQTFTEDTLYVVGGKD